MRSCAIRVVSICALALATQAQAQRPFYEGRTVTLVIGQSAGGTYDSYARVIGAHLARFLPGHPQVLIQNMPGANTLRATNYIYNIAPQDGTVIGAVASNIVFEPLLQAGGAKYDLGRINWLPAPAGSTNLLVTWHTAGAATFEDLRTHEVKLGSTTPTAPSSITAAIDRDVLGAKIKTVFGYQGLPDTYLAMQRGEVDGYPTVPLDVLKQRYQADWDSGHLRVLVQTGGARHRELPDVPTMLELATSAADKTLIRAGTIGASMTFAYLMGPGVPEERVGDMRAAMNSLYRDPAFLAAAKQRRLMIEPVEADSIVKSVAEIYSLPAALLRRFRAIVLAAPR